MNARSWEERHYTRRGFVRGIGLAAGALALAPAFVACGGRSKKTRAPAEASGAGGHGPVRGGTLTVRSMGDAINLDYAFTADLVSKFVISQCVEPLLALDSQFQPTGSLAESWETPDDHTYIFKLRQGVKFQDGAGLNADAVEYSQERLYQNAANLGAQSPPSIEKPDQGTVKFGLDAPSALFLYSHATSFGSVISPATAERYGKDKLKLDLTGLGTGPFKFTEWKSSDHVTLVRNEGYWGKDASGTALPYLDKLIVRVIPDLSQALASLRSGEIDAFRPTEGPATKDVAAVKADPSLSYQSTPGFGFQFIAFNVAKEPFNSRELRQAISYAIDRDAIVQSLFGDDGKPLDVLFASSSWAYDPDYHPYLKRDVNKAKQLLAQAGKASGFAFTLTIVAGNQQLAELIQDQLKEAGITVTIQQVDLPALQAAQRKGEQQAALSGYGGDPDPGGQVNPHFGSGGFQNFQSRYHNAEVDAILDRARTTLDMSQRKALYQQAQRLIMSDAPYCMLFPNLYSALTSKKVQAYPLRTGAPVSLAQVWKAG